MFTHLKWIMQTAFRITNDSGINRKKFVGNDV